MLKIQHKIHGYSEVGAYGLAHSLLAWARCFLWCKDNNVAMLSPDWIRIRGRVGPILRKERDKRAYHKLFDFKGNYITGFRRLFLLTVLKKKVITNSKDADNELSRGESQLLVFKNLLTLNEETNFNEIVGRSEEVRQALWAMTKVKYRPEKIDWPHIAIHVRMGDFRSGVSGKDLRKGAKNSRIPITWYKQMLNAIRGSKASEKAIVYSDGIDEELSLLLAMENVVRAPKQESVTDLLSIAQARILISSGSGFSMWGAYLGDVPRICFPGQRLHRVLVEITPHDREPECETGSDIPVALLHRG